MDDVEKLTLEGICLSCSDFKPCCVICGRCLDCRCTEVHADEAGAPFNPPHVKRTADKS